MGLEARVSGCSSHLSLCKHTQAAHARRRPQSSIHTRIHAHGPRGSETHANTRAHTHAPMHRETQTYNSRALRNTQAHMRPHAPCVVSEYCHRLGQRGRQRVTCPQMGLVHSAFPQGEIPRESCGPWAEELGFHEGGADARPLGEGGVGHRLGASPLHFAVIQPEVSGPGEAAERGRLEEGRGARTTAEEPHLYSTAV